MVTLLDEENIVQRLWLALLVAVFLLAVVFLIAGGLFTSHKLYSRFGKASASYEASDPALIREFSFG